jgi:hypothetical protein
MKEIVQIGIVVKDLWKAMKLYWEVFEIGPWNIYTFSPPKLEKTPFTKPPVYSFNVALAKTRNIQIELIQPLEGPSIYQDYIRRRGEGIHHIKEKLATEDIPNAIKKFREKGITVIGGGKYGSDEHYYLNTEDMLGFIYELGNDADVGPPEKTYPSKISKHQESEGK